MKRRVWVTALVAMLFCAGTQAAPTQQAQELVQTTADKILVKLQAERAEVKKNPDRVYALVDEIVLPHFDFVKMASWVLGKHWRTATPEQQERFTREFRTMLVRTYAKALVENMDRKIKYLPVRGPAEANDVTIHSEVPQQSGFPIPIDYSMYDKSGTWKVYDVSIDNVSLVANYRTTFAAEIRQNGMENLINKLGERNRQAAGKWLAPEKSPGAK